MDIFPHLAFPTQLEPEAVKPETYLLAVSGCVSAEPSRGVTVSCRWKSILVSRSTITRTVSDILRDLRYMSEGEQRRLHLSLIYERRTLQGIRDETRNRYHFVT